MTSNGFQQSAYAADQRPPSSQSSAAGDTDVGVDPASSGFFSSDYKKHDDLKEMLDSNKDSMKLEAMKRIIVMIAKGKNASDVFPAVVKNVVSKNIEVKKLVYVYLTRYAEEEQDLILLSISTFQRALKDPNPLFRAAALRVLSSIRVQVIVPIMMLAIKESVMDMSPYVRKTAAHAIPKLYSIDPEQKDQLIEVIEKLLGDKTTLVAGSVIQAFDEVCPDRFDLIHKNYRKLCTLLVDVDEWGQVPIINMLTRYCRQHFIDPNKQEADANEEEKAFYDSGDSETSDRVNVDEVKTKPYVMDPDHRLLLRNTKPLLNSRNSAVVLAVAQLYYHCAPSSEVGTVSRALIRLLRSAKEVQHVVLGTITSMSVTKKGMFEPHLKSFFVRSSDPTHCKLLKLEILTNLATETSISTILREFQTYVMSSDPDFAAATIQAIGRCASNIPEITDACLAGLVGLLSNRNEVVVGESVVIIKKLLQMQSSDHKDIIVHLSRLVDSITVPLARASILWLIGEYCERVPKVAPDVLRKMAKTFVDEDDIVKLQVLNLGAKLCITNPRQTQLLCQYVFNLAKYDQNYDIRDRTRFLRHLVLPGAENEGETGGVLAKHAKKIFLAAKPAPVIESKFKDREQYQLSTMSHIINQAAVGYRPLPDWPEVAPDPSVRVVEVQPSWMDMTKKKQRDKKKSFYSSSSSGTTEGADSHVSSMSESGSGDSSGSESNSSSRSGSSSGSESDSEGSSDKKKKPVKQKKDRKTSQPQPTTQMDLLVQTMAPPIASEHVKLDAEPSDSSTAGSASTEDSSSSSSESEQEAKPQAKKPIKTTAKKREEQPAVQRSEPPPSAALLDLDFGPTSSSPVILPGTLMAPSGPAPHKPAQAKPDYNALGAAFSPSTQHELLNKFSGSGLSATYRFTRTFSIFSPKMTSLELTFMNLGSEPITCIKTGEKKLQVDMELQEFAEINSLASGATSSVLMSVNFNDTTQPAKFEICTSDKKFNVKVEAPVGELLQPATMIEAEFLALQGKLKGMTENSTAIELATEKPGDIVQRILTIANTAPVASSNPDKLFLFAAKTVATGSDCLISLQLKENEKKSQLRVNCDKMVIGSMLMRDLVGKLSEK